jgi:hypothetical protein
MKEVVQKIIRVRKNLLKNERGYKNPLRSWKIIERLEGYFLNYPKASETAFKRYVQKHLDEILYLIPSNPAGDSLKSEILKHL